MAEQQATKAFSTMALNKPQPSFTGIPRELRDQIYGYLLDGAYNRVPRSFQSPNTTRVTASKDHGPIKAYRFHTNILATNHIIRKEAEEVLYERNVFVVFSYQWPDLTSNLGGLIWAPIVADHHVARMQHHSLRVHMSMNGDALEIYHRLGGRGSKVPMLSCLVLANDIQALCRSLECPMTTRQARIVHITQMPRDPLEIEMRGGSALHGTDTPPTLKIELRDTRFRRVDRDLQHDLLSPFPSVISSNMRTVFSGSIHDLDQVNSLKATMGPSLCCASAVFWATNQIFVHAKELADAAVHQDELAFATALYIMLAKDISVSFDGSEFLLNASELPIDLLRGICLTFMDVLLTLGWLLLKSQDFDAAKENTKRLGRHLEFCQARARIEMPDGMLEHIYHVILLSELYGKPRAPSYDAVRPLVDLLSKSSKELKPYHVHDCKILRRAKDSKMNSPDLLPFHQSSVSKLPLLVASYYHASSCSKTPARFDGWHDTDLIRSLDDGAKRRINALQTVHNMPVTQFD